MTAEITKLRQELSAREISKRSLENELEQAKSAMIKYTTVKTVFEEFGMYAEENVEENLRTFISEVIILKTWI